MTAEPLDEINVSGLQDISPEEQQQAKDLILEHACKFTMIYGSGHNLAEV